MGSKEVNSGILTIMEISHSAEFIPIAIGASFEMTENLSFNFIISICQGLLDFLVSNLAISLQG